jgi:tripeptide aminopeptidase
MPYALTPDADQRVRARRDWTLARQVALAATPAPTGHEVRRGDLVQHWLREQGVLRCARDEAGNVTARFASREYEDRAPVVVMAHLDTVFADAALPDARREGSRIIAPGISDNGRGLAALVTIAALLADTAAPVFGAGRDRPIDLVATVGEEGAGNLRGARHYLDARDARGLPRPAAVIALDGPGDSLIIHHAIASHRLRCRLRGPGGHPWTDVGRANAVHAAGVAIGAMAQFSASSPRGVTVHVTRVGGGESLTSIPAAAWFEIDVRTLEASAMPRVLDTVRRLVERAAPDMVVEYEILGDRPGGALDAQHPLVRLAAAATQRQSCTPQSASASTDANIALARAIPAIAIGAGGSGDGVHTAHEWYDDTDGPRGLVRALDIIVGAASGALPD